MRRKLNRRLDRQKKARMKQNWKASLNPLDATPSLTEIHTLKIAELKRDRNKLNLEQAKTELRKSDQLIHHDEHPDSLENNGRS